MVQHLRGCVAQPHTFQKCIIYGLTGLHIQKAHTNLGTSSTQILLLSAHACMHFS